MKVRCSSPVFIRQDSLMSSKEPASGYIAQAESLLLCTIAFETRMPNSVHSIHKSYSSSCF